MNLTGEQRVDYLLLRCRHCDQMPEIQYAGMDGCIPMLIATCSCGENRIKIFNRCDRFPVEPKDVAA